MKKSILFATIAALSFAITSCKKDSSATTPAAISTSKSTNIKQSEPVTFSVNNVDSGQKVTWAVTPTGNAVISANGSTAVIKFLKQGQFNVVASFGSTTLNQLININDSVYSAKDSTSNTDSIATLKGDQIMITPSISDSANSTFVTITSVTKNSYNCLNNNLQAQVTTASNAFNVNYTHVSVPMGAKCTSGQKVASSTMMLYSPADGTYSFKIKLNEVTYTGSYVKSGKSYTFTWPYASGVTISPLSVSK